MPIVKDDLTCRATDKGPPNLRKYMSLTTPSKKHVFGPNNEVTMSIPSSKIETWQLARVLHQKRESDRLLPSPDSIKREPLKILCESWYGRHPLNIPFSTMFLPERLVDYLNGVVARLYCPRCGRVGWFV